MRKKIKILIILIVILLIFTYIKSNNSICTFFNFKNSYNYEIIKSEKNDNYSGIGQENVKNQDGYFTTFTTSSQKTYKEYKQNGNSSWSNKKYWGGTMEENGCGITSIAIIASGYGLEITPEHLREKYYPVLDSSKISKELSDTFGINNSDFYYDNNHLSNNSIISHLKKDKPILICVWDKPINNRWTTSSHYMVLLATDNENKVYLSNPNGGKNDSKSSGWYNINEVTPYIAKALYIEN